MFSLDPRRCAPTIVYNKDLQCLAVNGSLGDFPRFAEESAAPDVCWNLFVALVLCEVSADRARASTSVVLNFRSGKCDTACFLNTSDVAFRGPSKVLVTVSSSTENGAGSSRPVVELDPSTSSVLTVMPAS